MRPSFTRPERNLRSELLSLLAVALVPFGIMFVFPYQAVGHSVKLAADNTEAFASIVFLTEEEETEAIQRARSAWQSADASTRGKEIDLSLESLPELSSSAVLDSPVIHVRQRPASASLAHVPITLPSLAAEAPSKAKTSTLMQEKFFDDKDLMKLK